MVHTSEMMQPDISNIYAEKWTEPLRCSPITSSVMAGWTPGILNKPSSSMPGLLNSRWRPVSQWRTKHTAADSSTVHGRQWRSSPPFPILNTALDLSHWVAMSERLIDDQETAIRLGASRAIHIDARVGHACGRPLGNLRLGQRPAPHPLRIAPRSIPARTQRHLCASPAGLFIVDSSETEA